MQKTSKEKYEYYKMKNIRWIEMNYRVHRFDIKMSSDQQRLEQFLNNLEGEVVSIIPNSANTSLFQIYGVTPKIDFLFIVEKLKK
jgi:hypothetical protein